MSQQIIVIPFTGQEIGQGYNRKSQETIGTALSVANISEDKAADGESVSTSFQMVTDQDSLRESLGFSAQVDARYLLFSTDDKVNFAESHAVNTASTFVAGRCLVKNAQRHGHGFQLTPEAEAVLKQDTASGENRFKTAFGDMFVRDLNTGGEFLVIARITSISEEHQQSLAASLNAAYNGLTVGGNFQTDFNTAMQETHNHTEVAVWMMQSGGIEEQASFVGPDSAKILDRLRDFPKIVHEHPVGYEAVLATYDTIPLPVPPEPVKEAYETVLADCVQQKMDFLRALADLDLALSPNGPLLFDSLPPNDVLTQMRGQYRTALNGLIRHAIQVATGQMDPPQLFVANPAPPVFSFKKKKFVPPVRVPDNLRGKTPELAHQQLTDLGLRFTDIKVPLEPTILQPGANSEVGKVVGSDPAAGTMVDLGSVITLQVGDDELPILERGDHQIHLRGH